jgi:hypothetical protein
VHGSATWIGNTPKVAKESYLQVTDDHFAKAAQNPAQHLHVHPGTKPQSEKPNIKKAPAMQGLASLCDLALNPSHCQTNLFGSQGSTWRHPNKRLFQSPEKFGLTRTSGPDWSRSTPTNTGETALSETGGTESGTLAAQLAQYDASLRMVIDTWPSLPESTKQSILALIQSSRE